MVKTRKSFAFVSFPLVCTLFQPTGDKSSTWSLVVFQTTIRMAGLIHEGEAETMNNRGDRDREKENE